MYLLILIFPFLGFFFSACFGRYFGRTGSAFLSTLGLFLSLILGLFMFYEVCICQSVMSLKLYTWVLLNIYSIEIGLLFDTVSVLMIVIITTISFFVHLYSTAYMSHDPHLSRFMSYLSLFTFFMLILVTADNFFQLFLGWEGVGLCSYLLINFWFTRLLANKAALKAMVMNRIADVFFIIAILLIFLTFKTTDYTLVFNLLPFIFDDKLYFINFYVNKINLIAFFLFVGAIGKSAQIGLHTWLPVAMEGPTPVSALLHAATMVTAGVFLVIRSSLFFEYSNNILVLLCIFGTITALFGSFVATFQYDIKRIIAYSTCSQLGYMFFSCGLSNYSVAFFHLFNHAFFKALLFLSAGALIHSLFDEQDIRKMGGFVIYLPFIYICIFIGSLAILGFPFLSGFYSKDLILELAFSRFMIESEMVYLLAILAAIFTSIYSLKILFYVFFTKKYNFYYVMILFWHNHDIIKFDFMMISMFCLVFLSIFSGYLFSDMFLGYGSSFWNNSIFLFFNHFFFIDIEFINPLIKNLPILLSLFFMFCFYILLDIRVNRVFFYNHINFFNFYKKISSFFYNSLFFDKLYNLIYLNILNYSYLVSSKYIDKGILEFFGPFGIYKLFHSMSLNFQNFIAPLLFYYIFIFFLSLTLFSFIIILLFFVDLNMFSENFSLIILIVLIFYLNLWCKI